MIVSEINELGQNLGNQLWCYTVIRTIALDLNLDFGFEHIERFKGKKFMDLDFGKSPNSSSFFYEEKRTYHPKHYHCNISKLDPALLKVQNNTKVDGIMQAEDYIIHRKNEICDWLKIKDYPLSFDPDSSCIINFRGGDFRKLPRFLNQDYYFNAIEYVKSKYPNLTFYVVTDDPETAKVYFPYEIIGRATNGISFEHAKDNSGDIGLDYFLINSAKYLILTNSSFSWWAAWTNKVAKLIIAPMYWTAYNISDGFWSSGDSLTRDWLYLDKQKNVFNYEECFKRKKEYEEKNSFLWPTYSRIYRNVGCHQLTKE